MTSLLSVTQPSRHLYQSCLSTRFYLFISLIRFNLFFCCCFLRIIVGLQWKVVWKTGYFPLSCIPLYVDLVSLTTEGLNMVSTLPGFQNYSWLIKRFTNPSIGPIRWHTVVVCFHHTLLHICLLTVLRQSCINTAQCTDLFGIVGMPISVVSHSTVKVQPREGFRNGAKTKAHIYRDSGISASWILLYFMPFF